ncbi:hypothetical protein [Streptomyces ipomoeae]|uniref:hypothetical protein n=1 Tax=Streptomyces ipomoeae TaxID=103232 RepID=UPI0029ABD1C9|nr:hypothetical protein [Streptomyces ipomoeae]MDX2700789.1 hypothetical protein [Streptomyces ipomoeae]MDX2845411.1 hypothetical protein [Streptomyces ipomoeae]
MLDAEPEWWRNQPVLRQPPPPPVPVDVHVIVTIDPGGALVPVEPEPGPRWWGRIRIAYNAACATCGLMVCGPWAWTLTEIRDESLPGAWVTAVIPLTVLGFLDNARRVEALHADPELWLPRVRAAIARTLLWAAGIATALALPISTVIYVLTGVRPS